MVRLTLVSLPRRVIDGRGGWKRVGDYTMAWRCTRRSERGYVVQYRALQGGWNERKIIGYDN